MPLLGENLGEHTLRQVDGDDADGTAFGGDQRFAEAGIDIAYGDTNITKENVIKFARYSAADEFISKMPEGYETIVGERGVGLSGGQKQRISLARALALDPDILFLDEPTAGLDPIGAAAFDQLLLTLRDALNLTVFLVTHDLDTLYTVCDRVAVLSQKKVLVADRLDVVAETDDAWVREFFHGPRGRAALQAKQHAGA